MKKVLKGFIKVFKGLALVIGILIIVLVSLYLGVVAMRHLPIYFHNNTLIELYNDNNELFNKYIESIDIDENSIAEMDFDDGYILETPDYLENLPIYRIEQVGPYVFFDAKLPIYCGIYYSAYDDYAPGTPFYNMIEGDFHVERGSIYVKGDKKTDRYITEKITDHWYYYEEHYEFD